MIHLLSGLKTSLGRSPEGAGNKVFNTIMQMEAGQLRENPQTPQQQETPQASTNAAKG